MVETPAFAIEFAKISLLTNVGRINTTMACSYLLCLPSIFPAYSSDSFISLFLVFPEMKTALRSYHPVPSLQKTDGNLQDAPRIKNCLKAALLPFEARGTPPTTPNAILENAVSKCHLLSLMPYPSQITYTNLSLGCRTATNDKCRKSDLCPIVIFHGIVLFPLSLHRLGHSFLFA